MFYKAAFYDRSARISFSGRFIVERCYSKYYAEKKGRGEVPKADSQWVEIFDVKEKKVLHRSEIFPDQNGGAFDQKLHDAMEKATKELCIGLKIGYPDCDDPFAYWD